MIQKSQFQQCKHCGRNTRPIAQTQKGTILNRTTTTNNKGKVKHFISDFVRVLSDMPMHTASVQKCNELHRIVCHTSIYAVEYLLQSYVNKHT